MKRRYAAGNGWILGLRFNNLDDMKMIHASYCDSYSVNDSNDKPITRQATYLSLDEFTDYNGYSEILYKQSSFKPNFIICYDKIDDYDLDMIDIYDFVKMIIFNILQ